MSLAKLHAQTISLKQLELIRLDLPQKATFKSGIGLRKSKETLLVRWTDEEDYVGYGECSCRPDPYYSAEFLDAASTMLQKFVFPFLKNEQTYGDVLTVMRRSRGWTFTKSAVEAAMLSIVQQRGDFQLSDVLQKEPLTHVPVGISLGIYDDPGHFKEVVQQAINDGYQRLKFKISPEVNTANFDAINPLLFDNKTYVGFDANGSFREDSLDTLGYFANTYQVPIEQPTPPGRFDIFREAKNRFPALRVCWDEEVKGIGDLVKLYELGVADELNLKIGRVGGATSSLNIMQYCFDHDIPCWIGGMFETGIGRLQNLDFASYLHQSKAHDMSPSSRYFEEDIIEPSIGMTRGFITVAEAELSAIMEDRIEKYTTNLESVLY